MHRVGSILLMSHERVMLGRYSPEGGDAAATPVEVKQGIGCEKRLIGWLTPPKTNAAPVL